MKKLKRENDTRKNGKEFATKKSLAERFIFFYCLFMSMYPVCAYAAIGTTQFFTDGVNLLKNIVVALGAGLLIWGVINLLEGYGNDNPGAKSQGIKQFAAGAGVAAIGWFLIPKLTELFNAMTAS